MENFPNICSCLFALNIILRLARNCHIKQIFENFSFLSTPRRSEFPLRHYLTPLSPFCRTPFFAPRRRAPTFPTLSSTTTTCHTLLTITNLTISPHRFLSHPRSPLFLPLLRGRRAPLSAYARFNLKKVFVIYVQKRKFVVE